MLNKSEIEQPHQEQKGFGHKEAMARFHFFHPKATDRLKRVAEQQRKAKKACDDLISPQPNTTNF